jgi:arylsulfatase A
MLTSFVGRFARLHAAPKLLCPLQFALALATVTGAAYAQAPKPNVIIMMADDMGIGDTSAYLGKQLEAGADPIGLTLKTPNMERLAQMGMVFTDAHSPSSACSTTRNAILTGRYAWRSNAPHNVPGSEWTGNPMIDPDRQTIGDLMKRAGYSTAAVGKWHQGLRMADKFGNQINLPPHTATVSDFNQVNWRTADNPNPIGPAVTLGPNQFGFDYYYGTVTNNDKAPGGIRAFLENDQFEGTLAWDSGPQALDWDGTKANERELNKALEVIDRHAGIGAPASTDPLFLYYKPHGNHSPWTPAPTISIQGQSVPIANQAKLTNNADGTIRDDLVWENDVALGALLDKLQNTIDPQTGGPMIDNSLIIFTSDNGADVKNPRNTGGLRDGKATIYEGGHRVPFIAAWAGHTPQGATSSQVFGLNDLYATLAQMNSVNLSPEEAEDSNSVLPIFEGNASFTRPGNLVNHDNFFFDGVPNDLPKGALLALRQGDMKLIVSPALVNTPLQPADVAGHAIPVKLFNLAVDPTESNNLLGNPAYTGLVEQMRRQLLKYHHQGFSRAGIRPTSGPMFSTDGGTDLKNGRNGAVGLEFTLGSTAAVVSRLGMWDDGLMDIQWQELNWPNPDGDTTGDPDGLARSHWVRLFDKATGQQLAAVQITNTNSTLEGEFRYVTLGSPIELEPGGQYALTMSTTFGDGDYFHDPLATTARRPISSSLINSFAARVATTDGAYPSLLPTGNVPEGAAERELYDFMTFLGPSASLSSLPGSIVPQRMGDFDGDGNTDGQDFLAWQRGVGKVNPTRADGDDNEDGVVDGLDLERWRLGFGSSAPPGAASAVPEPASALLALCAALAWRGCSRCAARKN